MNGSWASIIIIYYTEWPCGIVEQTTIWHGKQGAYGREVVSGKTTIWTKICLALMQVHWPQCPTISWSYIVFTKDFGLCLAVFLFTTIPLTILGNCDICVGDPSNPSRISWPQLQWPLFLPHCSLSLPRPYLKTLFQCWILNSNISCSDTTLILPASRPFLITTTPVL